MDGEGMGVWGRVPLTCCSELLNRSSCSKGLQLAVLRQALRAVQVAGRFVPAFRSVIYLLYKVNCKRIKLAIPFQEIPTSVHWIVKIDMGRDSSATEARTANEIYFLLASLLCTASACGRSQLCMNKGTSGFGWRYHSFSTLDLRGISTT